MCRLCVQRLPATAAAPLDEPGKAGSILLPPFTGKPTGLQDILDYILENPEVLVLLINLFLMLLGGIAPPRKDAK